MRGAILAGGGATRYGGRPKGLERIGGETILDRLVAAFRAAFGEPPLLVANAPEAPGWRPGLRVVPDVRPGAGSVGGILTAVHWGPGPVVVAAWDMPFIPEALLRALAEGLQHGYDACLPESGGRRGMEPLCAAYGPACGEAIEAALGAGDLRAIGFHDRIRVRTLPLEAVRRVGDPDFMFFNVNTPADLVKGESLWRRHASSPSSA